MHEDLLSAHHTHFGSLNFSHPMKQSSSRCGSHPDVDQCVLVPISSQPSSETIRMRGSKRERNGLPTRVGTEDSGVTFERPTHPDLPIPAFCVVLAFFFCFAVFLAFLCAFPFFPKDFKGSAERKILAFLRGIFFCRRKSKALRILSGYF